MDPASAIGVAASIATFLTIGFQVAERLKEYQSATHEAPAALRDVAVRLPVLLLKVQDVERLCRQGDMSAERSDVLLRVVNGCRRQVDRLDSLLRKLAPKQCSNIRDRSDSRFGLTIKGLRSLYKEKELRIIQQSLQSYESTLTLYFVAPEPSAIRRSGSHDSTLIYDVPATACHGFVGRQELLDRIATAFESHQYDGKSSTVVLLGMGGGFVSDICF